MTTAHYRYFGRLLLAAMLAGGVSSASADVSPQAEAVYVNADDMPDGPQETTASLGKSPDAVIHQWGIVRVGSISSSMRLNPRVLLSLPDFVHTQQPYSARSWLDYSALYVHPPLMLKAPLKLDVQMQVTSGSVAAWYPYATTSTTAVKWSDVLAGVQADGLMTTHPVWMGVRAVAAPATLKVYKPGPAGTKPDDPGTTEGDVFLFARAALDGPPARLDWSEKIPDVVLTETETTEPLHGWLITLARDSRDEPGFRIQSLSNKLQPTIENSNQTPTSSTEEVLSQLNEAFVGSGLDPDGAAALSRTILRGITTRGIPYGVAILPATWIDAALPLTVTGSPARKPVRVFVALVEL